jgi:hypothetical protein
MVLFAQTGGAEKALRDSRAGVYMSVKLSPSTVARSKCTSVGVPSQGSDPGGEGRGQGAGAGALPSGATVDVKAIHEMWRVALTQVRSGKPVAESLNPNEAGE